MKLYALLLSHWIYRHDSFCSTLCAYSLLTPSRVHIIHLHACAALPLLRVCSHLFELDVANVRPYLHLHVWKTSFNVIHHVVQLIRDSILQVDDLFFVLAECLTDDRDLPHHVSVQVLSPVLLVFRIQFLEGLYEAILHEVKVTLLILTDQVVPIGICVAEGPSCCNYEASYL